MQQVLVIKSAVDNVFENLLDFVCKNHTEVKCLIQSSRKMEYQKRYPQIHFIDCMREGFYDIPDEVTSRIEEESYEKIYIPMTGVKAYNFDNIMELIRNINFREIVFFHSKEQKIEIKKMNRFKTIFYRLCIMIFSKVYG